MHFLTFESFTVRASVAGGEIPLMDDLAFSVYQDSITAKIIRHLQDIKLTAVEREQFNEAKLLKQAIVDLQKVPICLL